MIECRYKKAKELAQELLSDVFNILEHAYGDEIADKIWSELFGEGEECEEVPQVDTIKKDIEELQKALEVIARMHGFN